MKFKQKIKNRSGFTLSEMMLAVLILLLATAIVAAGIPVAKNAYYKVVLGSNAQVLFSTAANALRGELGTARDVQIDGTSVTYISADTGSRSKIYLGTAEGYTGSTICLQEYAESSTSDFGIIGKVSTQAGHALVSKQAATEGLFVTYTGVSYANGVVTFTGFRVCKDSTNLVGDASSVLSIRVFPTPAE